MIRVYFYDLRVYLRFFHKIILVSTKLFSFRMEFLLLKSYLEDSVLLFFSPLCI